MYGIYGAVWGWGVWGSIRMGSMGAVWGWAVWDRVGRGSIGAEVYAYI